MPNFLSEGRFASTRSIVMTDVRPFWYAGGMDGDRDVLTVTEAAGELGMSVRGLQKRIERGDVRAERVNPRLWLIPRAEVERWKRLGRQRPGPRPARSVSGDQGDDTAMTTPICEQYLSSGRRITGGNRCGKPATQTRTAPRGETLHFCTRHANLYDKQRAEREAMERQFSAE